MVPSDEITHLEVHPSVVFKLGQDLITDDVQALTELVKNAYDADASEATIEVSTGFAESAEREQDALDPSDAADERLDFIRVVDNGTGMSIDQIKSGWLIVSSSAKRAMKAAGLLTRKGRTPLGDKGLGRLGAQRLGDVLEIETSTGDGWVHRLRIRWSDFDTAQSLSDVDLAIRSEPASPPNVSRHGTTITIRDLSSIWERENAADLERELAAMISPHEDRGFEARLVIDGASRDLRQRHREVRSAAMVHYAIEYDSSVLRCRADVSLSLFRPDNRSSQSERDDFARLLEPDQGAGFRTWLMANHAKTAASLGLGPGNGSVFLSAHRATALAAIDGIRIDANGEPLDPGPFGGEVDAVPLSFEPTDVFNTSAEYRKFVKAINGIRIYRDGFGIRVDKDWLGLAEQWSSGRSYYLLRPENVVGFIDLSARGNPQLEETTNREGFQDNSAYRNFLALMYAWRGFSEDLQNFVRRRYNEYRKDHPAASGQESVTVETATRRASDRRKQVEKTASAAAQLQARLEQNARDLESDASSLFPAGGSDSAVAAQAAADQARELVTEVAKLDSEYAEATADLAQITSQVEALQEQLSGAWEAISLGITAEALSHEVHQIADRLRTRSQAAGRYLKEHAINDKELHRFVEHVRSSASALNRQVSHLDPALRFMRERRRDLAVSDIAQSTATHYTDNWSDAGITVNVDVRKDFEVTMNEGKLTQVLDNLILNSGYWIREDRRKHPRTADTITITVDAPSITITDTGPGVDAGLAELIFEPFVTRKQGGRGLGLFVVRQLLETEGAAISLDRSEPNTPLRTFRISFDSISRGVAR
jgi:signal transduction histidine kinase